MPRPTLIALALAGALLVGCGGNTAAYTSGTPGSLLSTEAVVGGGVRSIAVRGNTVSISVAVTSTITTADRGITARVTLGNVSDQPITWRGLAMGWTARTGGGHLGRTVAFGVSNNFPAAPSRPIRSSLTLRPGQSFDTTVSSGPLAPGAYELFGAYAAADSSYQFGQADRTGENEIVVRVVPK